MALHHLQLAAPLHPRRADEINDLDSTGSYFLKTVIVQVSIPMGNYGPNSLIVGGRELCQNEMTAQQTADAYLQYFYGIKGKR